MKRLKGHHTKRRSHGRSKAPKWQRCVPPYSADARRPECASGSVQSILFKIMQLSSEHIVHMYAYSALEHVDEDKKVIGCSKCLHLALRSPGRLLEALPAIKRETCSLAMDSSHPQAMDLCGYLDNDAHTYLNIYRYSIYRTHLNNLKHHKQNKQILSARE